MDDPKLRSGERNTQGLIGKDLSFILVHIGKCAGSTVRDELLSKGFAFETVHLQVPPFRADARYVVMVRDPLQRFISAFHWRHYLITNDLRPRPEVSGATSRHQYLRLKIEREFFRQFNTVDSFAVAMARSSGAALADLLARVNLVGHVSTGFHWYLWELMNQLDGHQILALLDQRTLAADMRAVFGITPSLRNNSGYVAPASSLSDQGRAALLSFLADDYRALARLLALVGSTGGYLSVGYSGLNR
jgi:hypothetical protein